MIDLNELIYKARSKQDRVALLAYKSVQERVLRAMGIPGPNQGKALDEQAIVRLVQEEIKDRVDSNEFIAPTQSTYADNQHIITLLTRLVPR